MNIINAGLLISFGFIIGYWLRSVIYDYHEYMKSGNESEK